MSPNYTFWKSIQEKKEPFVVLAPMADVTDPAFRRMFAKYGKPDVTWTEFVSADGLSHDIAQAKLVLDLAYTEDERPIVAQLFTSSPENMARAVSLCKELGFDGVDLNMGCPDRNIEKQGSGAAHIKDKENSKAVYRVAVKAAGEMPVSIKTRIGYNKPEIDTWIREVLELNPPVLTVHLRTRKEMSLVPAHWEYMKEIVELRNIVSPNTMIIGNGDIISLADAYNKIQETGCDGIMVGRGVFGNPFFFNSDVDFSTVPLRERFDVLLEHTRLFEEILPHKNFAIMKKHYKAYVNNFDGAKELRTELMDAKDSDEIKRIIDIFMEKKGE